jgi:hypothetical protein
LLKGTQINGTTDIDGKYSLSVQETMYNIVLFYESVPIIIKSGITITLSKALERPAIN